MAYFVISVKLLGRELEIEGLSGNEQVVNQRNLLNKINYCLDVCLKATTVSVANLDNCTGGVSCFRNKTKKRQKRS